MDLEPYFKAHSFVSVHGKSILAELRRPEGPQSGAHTKEKDTHELISKQKAKQ